MDRLRGRLLRLVAGASLSVGASVAGGQPGEGENQDERLRERIEQRLERLEKERRVLGAALEASKEGADRADVVEMLRDLPVWGGAGAWGGWGQGGDGQRGWERGVDGGRGSGPGGRGEAGDRERGPEGLGREVGEGGGPPTDEEIAEALELLRETDPVAAERVEDLRARGDEAGGRMLRRVVGRVREMRRLRTEDPELFEMKRRELPAMRAVGERGLAAVRAREEGGDAAAADAALREAIREGLLLKREIRELEVSRMEARLDQMRREVEGYDLESEVERIFERVLRGVGKIEGLRGRRPDGDRGPRGDAGRGSRGGGPGGRGRE